MAPRTLPGLGLEAFFNLGEDGWNDEMDNNLMKLSVLSMLSVNSRVATVPGSPTNGDMHILTSAPNQYKIAVRDNGAWYYVTPTEGWLAYDRNTNNFVLYDGTTWDDYGTTGGITITRDVFTTIGANTWNKPANLLYSEVEVQGGGGPGGHATATEYHSSGAGGGAGGYARKLIAAASLGSTETATVGAAQGTSSFGSHCSASGGGAAGAGWSAGYPSGGGNSGTATGGDVNIPGGAGQPGSVGADLTTDLFSGGGNGGDSYFGRGGRGGYSSNNTGTKQAAQSAVGYGSGGGGAPGGMNTGGTGAGAQGIIIVTNYIQA